MEVECYRVYWVSPSCPDTFSIVKPKTSSNRKGIAWKTEVMHKTEEAGKGKGHHGRWQPPRAGRGCHHGLAVVASGPGGSSLLLYDAFYLTFCSAGCLSWAICIGLFGLVCFLSNLGLTSNQLFLIKFGPKL